MRRAAALAFGLCLGFGRPQLQHAHFTPLHLANLLTWYDAGAECDGIANGTRVATWDDLSGNGYNLTQGTVAAQPTCSTSPESLVRGKGYVTFDGTDDVLANAVGADIFAPASDATIFVVFNHDTSGDDGGLIAQDEGAGPFNDKWFLSIGLPSEPLNTINYHTQSATDAGFTLDSSSAYSTGTWYAVAAVRTSRTTRDWFNLTANDGTLEDDLNFPALTVDLNVGFYEVPAGGDGYFDGNIAEIIMYSRSLRQRERNQVMRYLCLKWGAWGTGTSCN